MPVQQIFHIVWVGLHYGTCGEETQDPEVFQSLAPGGTIAIAEFLVDEDRTGPLNGLFFAVNMLVNTDNGNTYSFGEISAWLADAGFINPAHCLRARSISTHPGQQAVVPMPTFSECCV